MRPQAMNLIDLLIIQGLNQLLKVFWKIRSLNRILESLDHRGLLLVTVIPLQRLVIIARGRVQKRFVMRVRCLQLFMKFVGLSSRLSHTRLNWLNNLTLILLTPMKSLMKRKRVSFISMTWNQALTNLELVMVPSCLLHQFIRTLLRSQSNSSTKKLWLDKRSKEPTSSFYLLYKTQSVMFTSEDI